MVDKGKYNKMSQKAFEEKMDKSMKKVVKDTEALAKKKYANTVSDKPKGGK